MKLQVDENLPVELALSSSEAGHDALTVLDQGLGGTRFLVPRLQRQDKPHVLAAFQRNLPLLGTEPLERKLWIVDEHRVRLRD